MGCGYETPLDAKDPELDPWRPDGWNASAFGTPTACVGYTAKLPAVLEIVPLLKHWEKGTLSERYGAISDVVWQRVEEMDSAEAHSKVAR